MRVNYKITPRVLVEYLYYDLHDKRQYLFDCLCHCTALITKACPCNIQRCSSEEKIENFIGKFLIFSIFRSKHTLWVHDRTSLRQF